MTVFGDLGCPGIDVDAWEKANRAPLFPGKVQRWILVRTDRDNPSIPDDIVQTLKAALGKWFEATPFDPLDPRGVRGLVDSVKVERISRERLTMTDRVKRREDLTLPPTVEAKVPIWIAVSFAYRGAASDMPWPVRKGGAIQLSSSAHCPVAADWILDQVGEPPKAEAPPLPPLGDALPDAAADVVNAAVFKTFGLPLLAVAGLLGLVILAKRSN